jgi:hypothetical protein
MTVDDSHTRQMPINGWVPAQRRDTAPPSVPAWPARDETMVLPTFVTSPKVADEAPAPEEKPAAPATPPDDDRLPTTERNMLIFVSLLLAMGTLAIVAMAVVGR